MKAIITPLPPNPILVKTGFFRDRDDIKGMDAAYLRALAAHLEKELSLPYDIPDELRKIAKRIKK